MDAVGEAVGTPVPYENAPRREGDPPSLYANASKANEGLDWEPHYKSIKEIIQSAWKWHSANPDGYGE
jgi:UDP-glucose 4-epimerase